MKKAPGGRFLWGAIALSFAVPVTAGQGALTPAMELDRLQGHWEGEGAGGKCAITIAGNALHYRAGTNWWKTTFTLPADTDPRQLHATIKDSSPPTNGIGTVIFAIFKLEDGILTLAETDGSDKPPETFASASSRYILKRSKPQDRSTEPPKARGTDCP
jgi:hypothetical protein